MSRREALARAGHNPIRLPASAVPFDLFSDVPQRALVDVAATEVDPDAVIAEFAPLTGDAALALATKGRAAEIALVDALELGAAPPVVLAHGLFSTTQAALARRGAILEDLAVAGDGSADVDLGALEARLAGGGVALVYLEVANSAHCGAPLREANVAAVRALCDRHGARLLVDAARPLTNAAARGEADLVAAAARLLAHAHAFTISCAKECLVPTGAVVGSRDAALIGRATLALFRAGTSLAWIDPPEPRAALCAGVRHVLGAPALVTERLALVREVGRRLVARGVAIVEPVAAHAIFLPLDRALVPGGDVAAALAVLAHLYLVAGVRAQIIGTKRGPTIRLAFPLRSACDPEALAAGVAAALATLADRPQRALVDGQLDFAFFRRLADG